MQNINSIMDMFFILEKKYKEIIQFIGLAIFSPIFNITSHLYSNPSSLCRDIIRSTYAASLSCFFFSSAMVPDHSFVALKNCVQ